MGAYERKKQYEPQVISDEEDKISNLPDCVLLHILSFLSTKDAVATCILSTRWKFLWTSLSNVDFDDSLLYTNEMNELYPLRMACFLNFVERVLRLHNDSVIEKFRLSCRVCFHGSLVYEWVSAAIIHKVREIDLFLFVEIPFTLPSSVFNSELLTGLKIQMNCVLELPVAISLPRLRTLHLALVTFPNEASTQVLLSCCPLLEELALLDCEWMNIKHITISIPTLKNLMIDDLPYFGSPDELNGCEIRIDAANLSSLKYIGHLLNKIFVSNLSSLVSASIDICIPSKSEKETAFRARRLLGGLLSIKYLHITSQTIESLLLTDSGLDCNPIFQNLTYLELSSEMEEQSARDLVRLLDHLPNVESLVFAKGFPHSECFCMGNWRSKPVPECFSVSLKSFSFHNFHGNRTDMSWLEWFLKGAFVLERLNVFFSKNLPGNSEKRKEIIKKLKKLPSISPRCLIMFS